uniref:Uncharacterized protein n=1 Tax=Trichinella nativa TaxID=6335 RepID=A0A0V1KHW8_9BILA
MGTICNHIPNIQLTMMASKSEICLPLPPKS